MLPFIEARMLLLSSTPNGESAPKTVDAVLKTCQCTSLDELEALIPALFTAFGLDWEQEAPWAERRHQYVLKAEQHYQTGKGFPIDVPALLQILDRLLPLQRALGAAANEHAGVSLFVEEDQRIFVSEQTALQFFKNINQQLKRASVFDTISELKNGPHDLIYRTSQLLMNLKQIAKLAPRVSEEGYLKGGYDPLATVTSRTNGLASQGLILLLHAGLRHLVKPKPGYAFIRYDWKAQEPWIAAVLAGDQQMLLDYSTGDLHTAFARQAYNQPALTAHSPEREAAKLINLRVLNGTGRAKLSATVPDGGRLFDFHHQRYSRYWQWTKELTEQVQHAGKLLLNDRWVYIAEQEVDFYLDGTPEPGSFQPVITKQWNYANAKLQGEGAGLLRALVLLLPPEIDVACTLHDALYVNCRLEDIKTTNELVQLSAAVAAQEYFNVNHSPFFEPTVYRSDLNERLTDPRGAAFWSLVQSDGPAPEPLPAPPAAPALLQFVKKKHPAPPEPVKAPAAAPAKLVMEEQDPVLKICEPKLSSDLLLRLPKKGLVLLRSGYGTGKTHLLTPLVEARRVERCTVLSIGHRVHTIQEGCKRLGLSCYLDLPKQGTAPYMGICIDSLARFNEHTLPPHTTLLDESEQVLLELVSKKLERKREPIVNALFRVLQAQVVIAADADLTSDLTLEVIRLLRGELRVQREECLGIINDFKYEGREVLVFGDQVRSKTQEGFGQLLLDALTAAENGEKLFIASNTKKRANTFARIFEAIPTLRVLLLTADTADDPADKAFRANPTQEQLKYDVVIASPTLETGISIDGEHFTRVYGFFFNYGDGHTLYQSAGQSIHRVRCANVFRVWFQQREKSAPVQSIESRYHEAIRLQRSKVLRFNLCAPNEPLSRENMIWARIYSTIHHHIDSCKRNIERQFLNEQAEKGYTITRVPFDNLLDAEGEAIFNDERKNDLEEQYALDVWSAADLDDDEFHEVERRSHKTPDEKLQVQKHRYRKILAPKDRWNFEYLEHALSQRLVPSLYEWDRYVNFTDLQRRAEDIRSQEEHQVTHTDSTDWSIRGLYVDEFVQQALGTSPKELIRRAQAALAQDEDLELTAEQLQRVAETFVRHERDLKLHFKTRIEKPLEPQNHTKIWNAVVGHSDQGAKLLNIEKARKIGPRGNQQQVYRFCLSADQRDVHGNLPKRSRSRSTVLENFVIQ